MDRKVHLVSYDVRDGQRLQKVAKLLEGYGDRIQYSVFRCRLTDRSRARLLWELGKLMEPEDALLVIPLCGHCAQGTIQRGSPLSWPKDDPEFTIL